MYPVPCLIRLRNFAVIKIDHPIFHIGKDKSTADYAIEDNAKISRHHADIIRRDGECFLVDINSTNGTLLNDTRIQSGQEYPLKNGDKVCFANEEFEFQDNSATVPLDLKALELVLQDGLQSMQKRIACATDDPEIINRTLHKILLDNPSLCHFEGEWRWDGAVVPVYTLNNIQRNMLSLRVDQILQKLPVRNASNRDAARIIYRWLCENVTYDRNAPHSQSAYGALVEHRAVCKGIAKAYQLLLQKLQIPCLLVEGTLDGQMKHVWNLLFLDFQWFHSDVTMYYPQFRSINRTGDPCGYQAVSPRDIVRTHTIWNPETLPKGAVFSSVVLKKVTFQSLNNRKNENPPTPNNLPPGILSQIRGDLQFISAGSVSDVWRASGKSGPVAIKRIPCGLDMNKLYYATRECAMLQRVQGAHAPVKLLCFDTARSEDGFTVYLMMEHHTPLSVICDQAELTLGDALKITLGACDALLQCYAAGVAHLDVQPGNLLVAADGTIKLADFSSAIPTAELPYLKQLRGTPAYLAPEVFQNQEYSQAGDVYSLGILLYCLLQGGKLPFGETLSVNDATLRRMDGQTVQLSKPIPMDVRVFFEKACRYNNFIRYSDLQTLKNELERLLKTYADTEETEFLKTARRLANTPPPKHVPVPPPPAPGFQIPGRPQAVPIAPVMSSTPPVAPPPMASAPRPAPAPQPAMSAFAPSQHFQADSFGETTVLGSYHSPAPPPAPDPVRMDTVQFSAIAPKKAIKGEYTLIQLFMYEQAFRSAVEEALEMMDVPAQEKKTGFYQVKDQTRVKVVLSSSDVEIMDDSVEQIWSGGYLTFDFALDVPIDCTKRQILLKASVYFNDIPATRLLLTLPLQSQHDQKLELMRSDVLKAFVSYASQDRPRVGALVQGMMKARPDMEIFFDVKDLHSGDQWEGTLYHRIEQSDTLFLCWSQNAKNSPWVDKEWRYALATKGVEAIEPIPIDPPDVCPPPQELAAKHFNDSLLYIINRP